MELISKQLRKLDIFGQEIRLQADSQSAFRTKIGAIMTLILFTILAYSSNSFILEMNKGKNAVLNSKDAVINPEDGYTFHSTELLFAAGLVDTMGQPIPNDNNRIFSITFYFCQKQYGENNCVNIPSIICGNRTSNISLLDVPQKYLNITYCIDENYLNNNPEIRIQGSPKLENFTQFGGLVQRCQNSTLSSNCASTEEIDRYITNSNLFYSYSFHYFNKEQEVSPYEKAQSIDSTPIFNKVGKYIRIYFKYSQSFIEYNPFYFFPQLKQIEGIEYENTAIDSTLNYEDNNNIALFELNLDAKKKIHFITYQTLMDVAAKIGGLFTILRVIFDVVLFPFQRISYRLYLANCLSKQQRNFINNDKNKGQDELNLYKLITSSVSRQLYLSQSMLIDKFLDITEILINPIKITKQMEDLQGSIKRYDILNSRNKNIVSELDEELVFDKNDGFLCMKQMSPLSINEEFRVGSQMNIKIPQLKVN
ncbi:unnamed protein product [Paramecium octaurelia]|uniref:Transmembrane protein n=1 Tax=Paramecium octaurelia TaxID=43137 RepID=A0A8S1W963_PAROT|nr:unnamed protein product [Paramecium octaurelia]CAD8185122.1 unnamed protein product [Paramecium octaurelia]